MKAPELTSERLVLKPLDTSFVSHDYVDWMNDREVNKYLESGGDYSMEKLQAYLEHVEKSKMLFWAIETNEGKHIGNIKIDPISWRNLVGEYGIMMGCKEEWGKGYAREASEVVIDFCFSEALGLRKITLGVVEDNAAALNLYKKMNFEVEGVYKNHARHLNKWCNVIRMAIFNPDWHD